MTTATLEQIAARMQTRIAKGGMTDKNIEVLEDWSQSLLEWHDDDHTPDEDQMAALKTLLAQLDELDRRDAPAPVPAPAGGPIAAAKGKPPAKVAKAASGPSGEPAGVTNAEFAAAIFGTLPQGHQIAIASFPDMQAPNWSARRTAPAGVPDQPDQNSYFCPSSLLPGKPRDAEHFAALAVLVLDDLTPEALAALPPPTYAIETSAGNHQAGYKLAEPMTDLPQARALHDALQRAGYCDSNGNNPVRWVRLPVGKNTKANKMFEHVLRAWGPGRTFTPEALVKSLGLKLEAPPATEAPATNDFSLRIAPSAQQLADARLMIAEARSKRLHADKGHERLWSSLARALCHVPGGPELFIEFSKGGLDYSEAACEAKLKEKREAIEKRPALETGMGGFFKALADADVANPAAGREPSRAAPATTPAQGFRFVPFRESIDSDAAPRWVLKNWLERDTLTCIAGQPKHGKSFVAFDMALHVAAGIPWCGNRVEQGSVFVICGEGQGGVSRRLKGWLNKHPAVGKGLPFFTSSRSIQLTGEGALAVREHIDALRLEHGDPAVVIIDTLARSFPGDENKNEDMSAFVAALDGHIKSLGAAVVLVHHATKSGSDVLRGASALRGALDGLVEVLRADSPSASGGIVVEVRPHFLKDGATPESLYFDCAVVATGTDEDLEEITTLVPVPIDRPGTALAGLTDTQRQALDVLHTMQGPYAGAGVPLREWRDACIDAGVNLGQGGQRAREGAMERLAAVLSAAACVFKPGGNDGKYRAVPFVDFDEVRDE